MADPTPPTEEEMAAELLTQFESYMVEIKRLLRGAATTVKHALNSLHINGYSLADLIAIIKGEVATHEADLNNPHNETLAQLGGMSADAFETSAGNYFLKDAMPISQIPTLVFSRAGNQLTIATQTMIYMGRIVTIQSQMVTLNAVAKQYLKLVANGSAPNWNVTFAMTTDDSESLTVAVAGIVTFNGSDWAVTLIPCVKIGPNRLSSAPRGFAIPYSTGTQAGAASIAAGWIN